MSKQTRNNLLNALLIVGTIAIVIYLGGRNGDLHASLEELFSADIHWLLIAFICWLIFVVNEALNVDIFYRMQHVKAGFMNTLIASMIGMFYSNVTPAATGGQPMQIYSMKKRGVPSGITTSALAVKFFTYQMALLITAVVLWILFPGCVDQNIGASRWFIYLGFLINGFAVGIVLLLAINKNIVRILISLIIKAGSKIRLIKDVSRTSSKCDAALEDFQTSVNMVTHHPLQLFCLFLISAVQVVAQMSITYCVYRALGLNEVHYFEILTLSYLLHIGASFMPLPGASGAQEGGFYIIFNSFFPSDTILAGLLLWRFITYYLTLIVGLFFVVFDSARNIKKNGSEQHDVFKQDADFSKDMIEREESDNT